MASVINQIISIEHKAQDMINYSNEERKKRLTEADTKKEQIKKETIRKSDNRLENIREQEKQLSDEKMAQIKKDSSAKIEKLTNLYNSSKDKWINAIFENITRV